jgi:uncharacterized membrane protein YbaN (DUF454 family)
MDGPITTSGLLRVVLLVLGWLFVGLAALGVLLPVLPTTPFLIVAAACFVRSSPRFYRWVVRSRLFGPLIQNWRATRTIPGRAKAIAIAFIVIVGGSSVVFFLTNPWVRLLLAATLLTLILWLLRVPTTAAVAATESASERTDWRRDA